MASTPTKMIVDLTPDGATEEELAGVETLRVAIHAELKLKPPPAEPPADIAHFFVRSVHSHANANAHRESV